MKRKLEKLRESTDAVLRDTQSKLQALFEYEPTPEEELRNHAGQEFAFFPDACPIEMWEPGYTYRVIDVSVSCDVRFGGYKFRDVEKVVITDHDLPDSVDFLGCTGYRQWDYDKRIKKDVKQRDDLDGRDDADSAWGSCSHALQLLGITFRPYSVTGHDELANTVIFSAPVSVDLGTAFRVEHVKFDLPCTFLEEHSLLVPKGDSIETLVHKSAGPCFRLASTFCYTDVVEVDTDNKSAQCEYFAVIRN